MGLWFLSSRLCAGEASKCHLGQAVTERGGLGGRLWGGGQPGPSKGKAWTAQLRPAPIIRGLDKAAKSLQKAREDTLPPLHKTSHILHFDK